MPAFTPRLNLYKPGDGVNISPDEAADIDKLNDNADLIDAAVGASIVTSGTRPASPYSGQVIFETDTGDLRVRSGSTWAMANRSDRATWNVADLTALAALSGSSIVKNGDLCVVQEGGAIFDRVAGVWVQKSPAVFATTGGRDTAYAKASAAYRVVGAEARVGTVMSTHNGTSWIPNNLYCSLIKSANQVLSAGTQTLVTFDTELSDPAGMHDNATNPSRVTVPVAGLYEVGFNAYSANATGTIGARVLKNGVVQAGTFQRRDCTGSAGGSLNLVGVFVQCAANDYLEIQLALSVAGNLSGSLSSDQSTILSVKRVGD